MAGTPSGCTTGRILERNSNTSDELSRGQDGVIRAMQLLVELWAADNHLLSQGADSRSLSAPEGEVAIG